MRTCYSVAALIMLISSDLYAGSAIWGQEPLRAGCICSFSDLDRYARALSLQKAPSPPDLPEAISNLSYDDYRMIAFRPERAIWWNQSKPFWFELFHRGFVHRNRVSVSVIHNQSESESPSEQPVPFDPSLFEYRGPLADRSVPVETGFAGVKIVGQFPKADDGQEMLTFLGASYFRGRTANTVYGSSSRGLALDAGTDKAEEFPAFTDLWIVEPDQDEKTLTVLALMNSESVVGAYQFELQPGTTNTIVDVKARLYFRNTDCKIGIAPLTSMWMWGDAIEPPPLDKRPSVHDADGLMIDAGDDGTIWRSLCRQSYPSLSRFEVAELHGFGLIQRERRYSRYLDDEAQYHRRPDIWIQPKSPWINGTVELLELPAPHEGHDNIAAFWVPGDQINIGEPVDLDYEVHFRSTKRKEDGFLARVVRHSLTRNEDGTIDVQLHFRGTAIAQLSDETPVLLDLLTVRGEVLKQESIKTKSGWRVDLKISPIDVDDPVEVQLTLRDSNRRLSETWSGLCSHRVPKYQFPQVYTRID
ncbi:Glucans biosynthesis protein G precursor [Thalassoglobus neptunius]|uniref:Glucans biosynthesis protein G n=1 Tax=Thalassoglobus neptunius TaxID=1938619 RepID=A0A5C5VP25_9PLAN|nr:glucan biosynthesis protein [Thalassoglobus neptunius]TWT39867.1 Glucans biosynthesis protein G precursor [Thalassoglobus neptunius]